MFRKIINFIKTRKEKKAALWQLEKMTDMQLEDIGIIRGEIYQKIYR